jgi:hypothetical protein
MAFPTTPIRSTFDGPDEDPLSEGGNWAGPTDVAGEVGLLEIISNQVTANAAASSTAHWLGGTYGPDVEVYITVPVLPTTASKAIGVTFRLANIGTDTTDGYFCLFVNAAASDVVNVYRVDNGAITQLGVSIAFTFAANDVIGARMIGDTITVFQNGTALDTRTDATYTAAGRIGLSATDTTVRGDSFGGGTYTPPTVGGQIGFGGLIGPPRRAIG